jgi:two-component system chemotaxis sensor kinase CheA
VSSIFTTLRQQTRESAKASKKNVRIRLSGGEYAVDRKVLEAIEDPLLHIIRNAVDHGIEDAKRREQVGKNPQGQIAVEARHLGDAVELTIADDGQGIAAEEIRRTMVARRGISPEKAAELSWDQLLDALFDSGFSTRNGVSSLSGRGVGLDVVKYTLERLGGEVRLDTLTGAGTAVTLRLPLAMSTIRCLLVETTECQMAIPSANVEKVIPISDKNTQAIGGGEVLVYDGINIPLISLVDVFKLRGGSTTGRVTDAPLAVLVKFGERRCAFAIDDIRDHAQLILKPLGDLLERVPNISGISLLPNGETAFVLNPGDLVRTAGGVSHRPQAKDPLLERKSQITALVVEDSITTRTLEKTLLESAGFKVFTASDGYKALDLLSSQTVDVVLSDVQMPNMDGFELTRTIRSRSDLAHLPVILITSLGSAEDRARGLACGADLYIVKKELTQRELVDSIYQLI